MIANLIDEYILMQKKEQSYPHQKFRVSDSGRCHLMRYWRRQGKPPTDEHDSKTLRVFEAGHIFHKWIQDILEEKGVLIGREFLVEDIHRIGHVDAMVLTPQGIVLYDFKTVNSNKFRYLKKEPDLHYLMQAHSYRTMLPFGVEDVRIAYISKDDLHIEEISIYEIVDNLEELVIQDWYTLIDAWLEQKEPAPNPKKWECKYCVYRSGCPQNGHIISDRLTL